MNKFVYEQCEHKQSNNYEQIDHKECDYGKNSLESDECEWSIMT